MATTYNEDTGIVISEEDARGGATGHNVRYVLFLGLGGVIAAFAVVATYLSFDRLQLKLAAALSHSPFEVIQAFAPYAASVVGVAAFATLALGVWNFIAGRSQDDSEAFMRFRVSLQFALISVIMAILYLSAG